MANLDGADLRSGVFTELSLQASSARGVKFDGSDLSGSFFAGTTLFRASFIAAKLTDVDFSSADVTGADFNEAIDMPPLPIRSLALNVPRDSNLLVKHAKGKSQFRSPYTFGINVC
eukprot:5063077-Pleurochrysis_carterae.AAC.2